MGAGSAQATGDDLAMKEPHVDATQHEWQIRWARTVLGLLGLALLMVELLLPTNSAQSQDYPRAYPSPRLLSAAVNAEPENVAAEPQWRRTAQGWERRESWITLPRSQPVCHPGLLAAFQALASLFALVAWPSRPLALASP